MNDHVLIPGDDLRIPADLSKASERLRLGPAGFQGFFAIAAHWNLTDDQAPGTTPLSPASNSSITASWICLDTFLGPLVYGALVASHFAFLPCFASTISLPKINFLRTMHPFDGEPERWHRGRHGSSAQQATAHRT